MRIQIIVGDVTDFTAEPLPPLDMVDGVLDIVGFSEEGWPIRQAETEDGTEVIVLRSDAP
jgi:hypothetical protein